MRQDRAILLYALVKGFNLNVVKIVEQSILDYPENNFSRNIPHLTLITLMCIKGGVTFSETEEKCPRSSPLTLTGVIKAPIQGEEVERTKKRKRETLELQREVAPPAEEELETEEMGVVEDYPKQLVLSLRAEENIMPAHTRVERGNKTIKE